MAHIFGQFLAMCACDAGQPKQPMQVELGQFWTVHIAYCNALGNPVNCRLLLEKCKQNSLNSVPLTKKNMRSGLAFKRFLHTNSTKINDVFIVSYSRTPMGAFQGMYLK